MYIQINNIPLRNISESTAKNEKKNPQKTTTPKTENTKHKHTSGQNILKI